MPARPEPVIRPAVAVMLVPLVAAICFLAWFVIPTGKSGANKTNDAAVQSSPTDGNHRPPSINPLLKQLFKPPPEPELSRYGFAKDLTEEERAWVEERRRRGIIDVKAVAAAPDAPIAATYMNRPVPEKVEFRTWDLLTGKPIDKWNDGFQPRLLALSPGGKLLAMLGTDSAGSGVKVRVRDLATRTNLFTVDAGHSVGLQRMNFTADGSALSFRGIGLVRMNLETKRWEVLGGTGQWAWVPGGNRVARGRANLIERFDSWDKLDRPASVIDAGGPVSRFDVSGDGRMVIAHVAVPQTKGRLRWWNSAGRMVADLEMTEPPDVLFASPCGRRAIYERGKTGPHGGSRASICNRDMRDIRPDLNQDSGYLAGFTGSGQCIHVDNDSINLSNAGDWNDHGPLRPTSFFTLPDSVDPPFAEAEPTPPPTRWVLVDPKTWMTKAAQLSAVAVTADGRRFACGSETGRVFVQDAEADGEALEMPDGIPGKSMRREIEVLRFSPDGKRLAAASPTHGAAVWDWANRKELVRPKGIEKTGGPNWINNECTEVWTVHEAIHRWSLETGEPLPSIPFTDRPLGFAESRTAHPILYYGRSGRMMLLDPAGKPYRVLEMGVKEVSCAAVSDDGRRAVLAGMKNLEFWNLSARLPVGTARYDMGMHHQIAISPDGTLVAAADEDKDTFLVFDTATGTLLQTVARPDGGFPRIRSGRPNPKLGWTRHLCFSADGTRLVAGSDTGFVVVWKVVAP